MLFLVGAGLTKSFAGLLVCRLLAGIAGAPVLAVGAGSSADMYPIHNRAVATSCFIMMVSFLSLVGSDEWRSKANGQTAVLGSLTVSVTRV